MRFTILEEIKSTLPKSLFYNYYSQIKPNVGFWWGENRSTRGKTSHDSREPTNSIHIWHRVRKSNPDYIGGRQVLSPLGQRGHHTFSLSVLLLFFFIYFFFTSCNFCTLTLRRISLWLLLVVVVLCHLKKLQYNRVFSLTWSLSLFFNQNQRKNSA